MPKNVMKLLKRTPTRSRNDFDLSHRHVFTANFGELLPATCIEVVPGDYIELSVSDLVRAIPLVTSPFLRAKQHFDVWYTPYDYLWHNYESFITKRDQPVSSATKSASFCPHDNIKHMVDTFNNVTTFKDVVGRNVGVTSKKIFDLLGYGRIYSTGSEDINPKVNLWRLAQYNKIWYDEYRQQYYDNGKRLLNQPSVESPALLFNFDDMACDTQYNASLSNYQYDSATDADGRLRAMTQMRYRCWKKDLFTGLMPSTQFGNVSVVNSRLVNPIFFSNNVTWQSGDSVTIDSYNTLVKTNNGSTVTGSSRWNILDSSAQNTSAGALSTFNILDLRKNEAIQLWREAALTAGNRISDNMRAHYGDDAEYNDMRSTFLGSVDAPINISDVNSTAQTGESVNGVLGDIAGKGLSSLDNKVIKFKAKKFGCIMVMFSILPEAEYESYGIDRMNQLLEPEDYFTPEYQDLGLEPVSSIDFYSNLTTVNKVIGYAPRYIGYKQKLDKCFGEFRGSGLFAPWASPKTDVTTAFNNGQSTLPLSTLYVNPTLYDRNFSVSIANSDQFLVDVYFDVPAVRPMSISGLPRS